MISMDDFFTVEYARKELIRKMQEKGISKKEIDKFIEICDKEYKENKIPYPDLD